MVNTRSSFSSNTRLRALSKNKSFRNYSYLVFSFIAIIIFAVFAIRPTIKNIISLEETIQQKKQTLDNLNKKSNDLDEAIVNFNAISDDTKLKLYTLLPDSTNLPCYLDYLDSFVVKSSIKILGLQFQPFDLRGVTICTPATANLDQFKKNAINQTALTELPFAFNSTGNYADLVSTLDTLSHANRLTSIQTVVFNKVQDSPLVMSINGKIFFYK